MRILINVVLIILIIGLILALYGGIQEPIKFKAEKDRREQVVITKLMQIRTAQELFRNITEQFAPNFDTLKQVLETEKFSIVSVIGDPDDPNFKGVITYDTTYSPAIDSVRALGLNLDSLKYVPFGGGATFNIEADVIDYQSTKVPVVEVGVKRKVFMGRFGDTRFKKYDQKFNPESPLKFGNLTAPNLSGNWER